jgi:hypothetical protein
MLQRNIDRGTRLQQGGNSARPDSDLVPGEEPFGRSAQR